MKLNEQWDYDPFEDRLTVKQTHDPTPTIDSVKDLKARGVEGFSDHKHVGRVPTFLIEDWLKEEGVSFQDQEKVKEVVHRRLLSGEFNALRPWTGTYNWS